MDENAETTIKKQRGRPFPKGVSGNPAGRPPGSIGYETKMKEAIAAYAKANNQKPEEVELKLYMSGISGVLNRNYNYYKDYLDRKYGKAKENIEFQGSIDAYTHKDLDEEMEAELKEFIQWRKDKLLK